MGYRVVWKDDRWCGIRCVAGVCAGRVYGREERYPFFYEVIKNCPRFCKVALNGRKVNVSSASALGAQ